MHTSLGRRFLNLLSTAWAMPLTYHLMLLFWVLLLRLVDGQVVAQVSLAFASWHPGAELVRLRRPAGAPEHTC